MENLKPCPYDVKVIVKGNCCSCGKPLSNDDGLFLCKDCKAISDSLNYDFCGTQIPTVRRSNDG